MLLRKLNWKVCLFSYYLLVETVCSYISECKILTLKLDGEGNISDAVEKANLEGTFIFMLHVLIG